MKLSDHRKDIVPGSYAREVEEMFGIELGLSENKRGLVLGPPESITDEAKAYVADHRRLLTFDLRDAEYESWQREWQQHFAADIPRARDKTQQAQHDTLNDQFASSRLRYQQGRGTPEEAENEVIQINEDAARMFGTKGE